MSSDPFRPGIAQIEHVALATNDLERLRDFYQQLGAVASPPCSDPDTGVRSCVLDFCGVRLELFEMPASGEGAADVRRAPGFVHLGFALESADAVDELSRVIDSAGHRVLEPPRRSGGLGRYESVVLDPDCNRIKLTDEVLLPRASRRGTGTAGCSWTAVLSQPRPNRGGLRRSSRSFVAAMFD